MTRLIATLAVVLGVVATANATAADTLETVRACRPIPNDAERLACYDRALETSPLASANEASVRSATSATANAAAATEPTAAAADFGLSEQARRQRANLESAASIESTVDAVGRTASEHQVVTLGNGQVWVQVEASTRVRLKPGDTVTIKRAAMGSYLLEKPNQGAMRVKRLE